MQLSIIIPVFNEAEGILPTLDELKSSLKEIESITRHEILVVDDGSVDGTSSRIKGDENVVVLNHDRNRGAGAAIKTGILNSTYELNLIIDGDGTYPSTFLKYFLDKIDKADQVVGSRSNEAGSLAPLRKAAKSLLRKLGECITGAKIPDLNSGMRLLRRDDVLKIIDILPDSHSCVSTLTILYLALGYRVDYVDIPYRKRVGTSKFHIVRDTFLYVLQILRAGMVVSPLRIFLPVSLFFCGAGILKSTYDYLGHGTLEESDIILIIGGLLFFAIGLIGDMISVYMRKAMRK